jgi:preprotein translocase subunit SecG
VPGIGLVAEATVPPAGTQAASVASPGVVSYVSPQKRLVALLLALPLVIPAGMHRIYVGKIGTGILWFFTGGMFMIGQIVDIVLILAGRFQDKEGRLLHHWTRPNPGQEAIPMYGRSATTVQTSTNQVSAVQARPPRQWSFFAGLLAFIGYILLIAGLLTGLAISLHLPWLIASGVPDHYLAQELERNFGYADWPNLVERIGWIVTAAFLLLALIFLILARRRHGIVHLVRAVAGIVLLTVSLACLYYALPGREVYLSPAFKVQASIGRPGPVLDQVLGAIQIPFVIGSVAALIVGLTVMSWPATRQRRQEKVLSEYDKAV